MNNMENYLITFGETIGKEIHSIVEASVKTFFKSKGELATFTINNYMNARFDKRLEDFSYEEEQISDQDKKNFYENINYEKLNYLFELLNKTRTSTFDLHAKILAKIYSDFLRENFLFYYDKILLSNINNLTDQDFEIFYRIISSRTGIGIHKKYEIENNITTSLVEVSVIEKFIYLGYFLRNKSGNRLGQNIEMSSNEITFILTDAAQRLYNRLDDIFSDKEKYSIINSSII